MSNIISPISSEITNEPVPDNGLNTSVENTFSDINITEEDVDAIIPAASAFNPKDVSVSTEPTIAPTTPVLTATSEPPVIYSPEVRLMEFIPLELQQKNETDDKYRIRMIYMNNIRKIFPNLDENTVIVIGQMATNNFYLNTTYSNEVQGLIKYINDNLS